MYNVILTAVNQNCEDDICTTVCCAVHVTVNR